MKNKLIQQSLAIILSTVLMFTFAIVPTQTHAATLTRQLQIGMRGADVTSLQMFLRTDPTVYPEGMVTGYYGALTRAAVMRFQMKHGISPVGRVGPQTLVAINYYLSSGGYGYDENAPIISNVTVSTTSSSATVTWYTNENASGILYYSLTPFTLREATSPTSGIGISGTPVVAHTDLRTNHSVTLNNLQPNTQYFYLVYDRDQAGNESIIWPVVFRTK